MEVQGIWFSLWQKNHWEVLCRKMIQSDAHHRSLDCWHWCWILCWGRALWSAWQHPCLHPLDSSGTPPHTVVTKCPQTLPIIHWSENHRAAVRSQGWGPKTRIDEADVISEWVTAELRWFFLIPLMECGCTTSASSYTENVPSAPCANSSPLKPLVSSPTHLTVDPCWLPQQSLPFSGPQPCVCFSVHTSPS